MTQAREDIREYLSALKTRVDRRLDELLPPAGRYPSRIHECMRYSVINGGKRIRPALMAAVAAAFGRSVEDVLSAVCAVEMVHVCSLILDDLPSMDNATVRHGRKANHLVFGESNAILAAVALLNQAYAILSDSCSERDGTRGAVIDETVKMVGTAGIIGGQFVDLESTGKPIDEDTLEYIESHKTGALIVGAVRIAAVLSGADPGQLDALTRFARNLGVAYQIADDILHLTRQPEELGKRSLRDESTVNYARTHGLDESRRSLEKFTRQAIAALDVFGDHADRLRGLTRYLADRAS
ncbi:MAG TPA: polyprenyl synthetase family protein [Planctomycetota bacterium]|nr:polyprenyl synthetase family protein [Planctomycetota bacterium]